MKIVVIHQPDFLPYLGFFHRLLKANLFILLDHVQFVSNGSRSWTNRDKIKTFKGEHWLTVSVTKMPRGTPINKIRLADNDWRKRNLNILFENYRYAPYFKEIFPHLEQLYNMQCDYLVQFNEASIRMLMELFAIDIPVTYSSLMGPTGKKNEMLVNLLKNVDATDYLSGVGAKDYLDEKSFSNANIKVRWQKFKHPVYRQQFGEFIPYLSSIDLFFNCGVEKSREIIRGA